MQISSTRTDNKSDSEKRYFRIEVYLNLSNIPAKTRFTRSTWRLQLRFKHLERKNSNTTVTEYDVLNHTK